MVQAIKTPKSYIILYFIFYRKKRVAIEFFTRLKGQNEVPPVQTNASGEIAFRLSEDRERLRFKLFLRNIKNVTVAHIHLGQRGENGPVVVFLFGPLTKAVSIGESVFTGVIRRDDLVGPLACCSLDDLVEEMSFGNAYVNVHTVQYPDGEIRGQIFSC